MPAKTFFTQSLAQTDVAIAAAIADELKRQQDGIELIASENIVSRAVLEAQGSIMTNNMPKVMWDGVIMAGANPWMWRNGWRLNALANYLTVNLPMFSRILDRRLIRR